VVDGLLKSALARGNGAMVQRESYGQAASVQADSVLAVVTEVVRRTAPDRHGGLPAGLPARVGVASML
jgi:hypothetical protein